MSFLGTLSLDDIIAAVSLLAAAIFGIKYGKAKGKNDEQAAKIGELELNAKAVENKAEVDARFSGMSDDAILDDALAGGTKKEVPKP